VIDPRLGQAAHATGSGEHRRPGRRDITAERRGRAESGDDNANSVVAAHCNLPLLSPGGTTPVPPAVTTRGPDRKNRDFIRPARRDDAVEPLRAPEGDGALNSAR